MQQQFSIDGHDALRELTLRGFILGALLTVVFTASNVYLGLKVGLTFSSSIPAAVISMAVLSFFSHSNILENNMVQTQASAAGTLSSIIFVLPGLLMVGYWQGFPFWQTFAICAAGGMLGVVFSIPLRHVMVVKSDLPYPEGVAAAEILRVGSTLRENKAAGEGAKTDSGARDIMAGGLVAALVSFATNGLRVLSDGFSYWFGVAGGVSQIPVGFSLALIGAGYLIGTVAGVAIFLGLVFDWLIAVPYLSAHAQGLPAEVMNNLSALGMTVWRTQVRFIGAGVMAVAAVWTLITLLKPMIEGVKLSFQAMAGGGAGGDVPREAQDMTPRSILAVTLVMVLILLVTFGSFVADAPLSTGLAVLLVVACVGFAFALGFLVAAACGYMAGLVGSSSSPISGIGIIGIAAASLLLLAIGQGSGLLETREGMNFAIALAIFTTSAVIAVASIANDNLQDLKTGWLVGATPRRQQIALLVGCVVGAAVISPVLELLYHAYGFTGAMPREGMDAAQALSAPQATLMTTIASGIFSSALQWDMIGFGAGLGVLVILVDLALKARGGKARLPALAVGIGIYLPAAVTVPLVIGALLAWCVERALRRRAARENLPYAALAKAADRRGVLLASGLIVGESLVGVAIAIVIVVSVSGGGSDAPLSIAGLFGAGFGRVAEWLGLAVFVAACWAFVRRVRAVRPD
ncbi:MAG: oligopeptide transporter, OPT family [Candidatus Dactylopiibacterium sp.]|nr:oligopeptide transporter, OPT family [Candidatus Dactylopiibacterium sp.]